MTPEEANGVVSVWQMQFHDMPADIVFMALNKHIGSNKFSPTPAEIKENITHLHWEAAAMLNYGRSIGANEISKEEKKEYQRIMLYTDKYRMNSGLSIKELLPFKNSNLLLEKGSSE